MSFGLFFKVDSFQIPHKQAHRVEGEHSRALEDNASYPHHLQHLLSTSSTYGFRMDISCSFAEVQGKTLIWSFWKQLIEKVRCSS